MTHVFLKGDTPILNSLFSSPLRGCIPDVSRGNLLSSTCPVTCSGSPPNPPSPEKPPTRDETTYKVPTAILAFSFLLVHLIKDSSTQKSGQVSQLLPLSPEPLQHCRGEARASHLPGSGTGSQARPRSPLFSHCAPSRLSRSR